METTETEGQSLQNQQKDQYHISLGSAATGIHFSTDIDLDDPRMDAKLDAFVEKWMQATIMVDRYRRQLKGN
jgi:hypothetical protein